MATGLEARIADALVTRLVESRLSEALMDQVLQALAENRNVDRLVVNLLQQPDVNGSVEQLVVRLLQQPGVDGSVEQLVVRLLQQPGVNGSVEQFVVHLLGQPGVNRAVDGIVDRQLERVLHSLRQSAELRDLVREQVDVYLKHLTANPEPIRELIQDQSRGMVRDILAGVRARAVVADDAVDAWVRRGLGRA
ncbi:MAG: hypothetical protein RJA59_702 [Pseudomonadota bacterium]